MATTELKKNLGYVCKMEKGYVSDLISKVGQEAYAQFESVGFITKGHTLRSETWKKTKLADSYYKDMFGWWAYTFK